MQEKFQNKKGLLIAIPFIFNKVYFEKTQTVYSFELSIPLLWYA